MTIDRALVNTQADTSPDAGPAGTPGPDARIGLLARDLRAAGAGRS